MINKYRVNQVLGELNLESARIIKRFLADEITEAEFRSSILTLRQKYYDGLIQEEVITASEEGYQQIVVMGKAIPLAIETTLRCKSGEITWKELSNVCSHQILPLARQEVENLDKV